MRLTLSAELGVLTPQTNPERFIHPTKQKYEFNIMRGATYGQKKAQRYSPKNISHHAADHLLNYIILPEGFG